MKRFFFLSLFFALFQTAAPGQSQLASADASSDDFRLRLEVGKTYFIDCRETYNRLVWDEEYPYGPP